MSHKKTITQIVVLILLIVGAFYLFVGNKSINNPTDTSTEIPQPVPSKTVYDTNPSTTYITAQGTWPPLVSTTPGTFACIPSGEVVLQNGKTEQKIIDGTSYCVTVSSEGAAGSTYTTYTYIREARPGELSTLAFTLKAVQCMNYDDPEQSACLAERAAFDPDILAHHIIENTLE